MIRLRNEDSYGNRSKKNLSTHRPREAFFPYHISLCVIFRPQLKSVFKHWCKPIIDVAYGITSKAPDQASPAQVLRDNREHWCIENSCHYIIDWNYDEDRSRMRKGHGPENMTRLRRFAAGLIKSHGVRGVAQNMRELTLNTRNSCGLSAV